MCDQVSLWQGGISLSSPTARVGSLAHGEVITLDQHAHLRDVKLPLNALSAGCVPAFALGQHAQVRVLAQPLVPAHCVLRAKAQSNAVAMHQHGLYHIQDCLQSYVHRSHVSTVHSMFLCGPSSCMHILSLLY